MIQMRRMQPVTTALVTFMCFLLGSTSLAAPREEKDSGNKIRGCLIEYGHAAAPSTATVVYEHETYLSFPAIAHVGDKLVVIFRLAKGNSLDFDSNILITTSDDNGRNWSEPKTWIDEAGVDSRNCGGGPLSGGRIHFVYDMHGGCGAWRRTYYRTSTDGLNWSAPIRLRADLPGGGRNQKTSVANRGILWNKNGTLYFPHFLDLGNSVLVHPDGTQTQTFSVPRIEPAVAFNSQQELVAFSKGGTVDVSRDRGRTWQAVTQLYTISQPDLIRLSDGRLLFCYSGKHRLCELLSVSKDGHDVNNRRATKIFQGFSDGNANSRGKAMCLEYGNEILTVLYEARRETEPSRGKSRIYLIRTPKSILEERSQTDDICQE